MTTFVQCLQVEHQPSKGVMMPNAHCVCFAIGTIELQLKKITFFYISLPLFHKWIIYTTLSMHYDWCKQL